MSLGRMRELNIEDEIRTLDPEKIILSGREGAKRIEFLIKQSSGVLGGQIIELFGEDSFSDCQFLVSDDGQLDIVFSGDLKKFKDAEKLRELIRIADDTAKAIKLLIKQGVKLPFKYRLNKPKAETARSLLAKLGKAEKRDVGPAEQVIRKELDELGIFTKFTANGKVMFVGGKELNQEKRALAKERVEKNLAELLANGEEIPSEFVWTDEDEKVPKEPMGLTSRE